MNRLPLLLIFIISSSMRIFGQTTIDAGMWNTLTVEKKVAKKFSLFLTEEYRIRENFTQTNLFYTEIGGEFKLSKFIKASASYRSIQKYVNNESFSFRHRISFNLLFKGKIKNFSLSYRHRIQSELRNIYSSELGMVPEWYSRSKFEIKYELDKPLTPYLATELRYQINNPRIVEANHLWHRVRYIAGASYKLNDLHSFGIFYLHQQEYNVSAPQYLHILGLEYTLSL